MIDFAKSRTAFSLLLSGYFYKIIPRSARHRPRIFVSPLRLLSCRLPLLLLLLLTLRLGLKIRQLLETESINIIGLAFYCYNITYGQTMPLEIRRVIYVEFGI